MAVKNSELWLFNKAMLTCIAWLAELRIHDEIERGDNNSIKKPTNLAATPVSCCGGGK